MWLEHLLVHVLNGQRAKEPRESSGLLLGTSQPPHAGRVYWPDVRRFEHAAVLGHSGSGKTHFLEVLAAQHMRRDEGFAFFDFHGDATRHLLRLATQYPAAADRLLLVDLADAGLSPGLNVLEVGRGATPFMKASELSAVLRQRWGVDAFGARTEELLRNTLFTLSATGCTLVEVPLLLTSEPFRSTLVARLDQGDIRDYWTDRYEPLSEAMKAAFREPLLNKVTAFLTEPATRHLLGQQRSTFDFGQAMNRGNWVLIRLPKGQLREHAHTLGNLFFAQLQFAAMARVSIPEGERRLFTVMCDEVQNLAENDLMTLFAEGRKFGVSLITANQFWEQLPRQLRATLLSAASHVFFRLSAADAGVLAGELSVAQRNRYQTELTELSRGHALVRVGSQSPRAVSVPALRIPDDAESQVSRLCSLSAARYMRPRQDVEIAIRNRRGAPRQRPPINRRANEHTDEGQEEW